MGRQEEGKYSHISLGDRQIFQDHLRLILGSSVSNRTQL